ncbi:MAG: hypothetical protein E6G38_06445 [Actinobacteria bacterium]|nr:MAG: hypothetical protein E6G38_06445 [Actinomycetota bacterium]
MKRYDVVLGPLATAGGLLLGLSLWRRSWKLGATGVAAIVADQRLPAAWRLRERLRKHAPQA